MTGGRVPRCTVGQGGWLPRARQFRVATVVWTRNLAICAHIQAPGGHMGWAWQAVLPLGYPTEILRRRGVIRFAAATRTAAAQVPDPMPPVQHDE